MKKKETVKSMRKHLDEMKTMGDLLKELKESQHYKENDVPKPEKVYSAWTIAGFVLGVLTSGFLALIFSAIAYNKITKNPEKYKGMGLTIAGLVLGIIFSIIQVVAILFILMVGLS